ncbi:MAG: hypothetical protein HY769_10105 [Candidatus Stahlbacteria bacterium]|nr:hypothetical protein [Candidatus Stahlbacteria bacterium]
MQGILMSIIVLVLQAKPVAVSKVNSDVPILGSKNIPQEINYQGWLGSATDTSNSGITDTLGMLFRLYTTSTGGSSVWSEAHIAVPVSKGIFNVLLGSETPIPLTIFTGAPLWLEIQVMTEILSPRQKLVSVGYAIKALKADTADYAKSTNVLYVDSSRISANSYQWNGNVWGTEYPKANIADTANYVPGGGGTMQFNIQSDPAEHTSATDNWDKVMTFNFAPPSDSTIVTELALICEMKRTFTNPMQPGGVSPGIIISALNMGSYAFSNYNGVSDNVWRKDTIPCFFTAIEDTIYNNFRMHYPCYFTGESNYSVKVYIKATDSSTGYIRNSTLVVEYLER